MKWLAFLSTGRSASMRRFRAVLGRVRIIEEATLKRARAVCLEHENSEAGLAEE